MPNYNSNTLRKREANEAAAKEAEKAEKAAHAKKTTDHTKKDDD